MRALLIGLIAAASLCGQTLVMSEATGRESTGNGNGSGPQFGTSPWTVHFYYLGPYKTGALGGSSNCMLIARTASSALTLSAWSDDKSDTFTKVDSFNDLSFGIGAGVQGDVYVTQATAGATSFSFTVTGTVADGTTGGTGISVHAQEFAGCAGTINNGGAAHNSGTGKSLSVTTTGTSFLWEFGVDVTGISQNLTSITAGSGFSLLTANRWAGELTQWNPNTVSSGSHTVAYTTSGSDHFDTILVALNTAAGGNTPSTGGSSFGFYISHMADEWEDTTIHTVQFPSQGSAVVGLMVGATLASLTDSGGAGSWVVGSIGTGSGKLGYCGSSGDIPSHAVYNLGVTTSATLTISPVYSTCAQNTEIALGQGLNTIQLFDLVGSPTLDTSHVTNGNQASAGTLTADSITPAAANELVWNITPWANGTATGTTTSNASFTISWDTWDSNFGTCTGPSQLQDDDGRGIVVSTGATSISWVYTNTGGASCNNGGGSVTEGAVGAWSSTSLALKGPAVAASGPLSLTLLGVQ